jgi:hypothetical protein
MRSRRPLTSIDRQAFKSQFCRSGAALRGTIARGLTASRRAATAAWRFVDIEIFGHDAGNLAKSCAAEAIQLRANELDHRGLANTLGARHPDWDRATVRLNDDFGDCRGDTAEI